MAAVGAAAAAAAAVVGAAFPLGGSFAAVVACLAPVVALGLPLAGAEMRVASTVGVGALGVAVESRLGGVTGRAGGCGAGAGGLALDEGGGPLGRSGVFALGGVIGPSAAAAGAGTGRVAAAGGAAGLALLSAAFGLALAGVATTVGEGGFGVVLALALGVAAGRVGGCGDAGVPVLGEVVGRSEACERSAGGAAVGVTLVGVEGIVVSTGRGVVVGGRDVSAVDVAVLMGLSRGSECTGALGPSGFDEGWPEAGGGGTEWAEPAAVLGGVGGAAWATLAGRACGAGGAGAGKGARGSSSRCFSIARSTSSAPAIFKIVASFGSGLIS